MLLLQCQEEFDNLSEAISEWLGPPAGRRKPVAPISSAKAQAAPEQTSDADLTVNTGLPFLFPILLSGYFIC